MADITLIFPVHPHVAFWCLDGRRQRLIKQLCDNSVSLDDMCDALQPPNCPDREEDLKQQDYAVTQYLGGLMWYREGGYEL